MLDEENGGNSSPLAGIWSVMAMKITTSGGRKSMMTYDVDDVQWRRAGNQNSWCWISNVPTPWRKHQDQEGGRRQNCRANMPWKCDENMDALLLPCAFATDRKRRCGPNSKYGDYRKRRKNAKNFAPTALLVGQTNNFDAVFSAKMEDAVEWAVYISAIWLNANLPNEKSKNLLKKDVHQNSRIESEKFDV